MDSARGRVASEASNCDGRSLDEYVRRHGPLGLNDLKAVMRPIAEGLQDAHTKNIFHRDVKPANILVRRDETRWRMWF